LVFTCLFFTKSLAFIDTCTKQSFYTLHAYTPMFLHLAYMHTKVSTPFMHAFQGFFCIPAYQGLYTLLPTLIPRFKHLISLIFICLFSTSSLAHIDTCISSPTYTNIYLSPTSAGTYICFQIIVHDSTFFFLSFEFIYMNDHQISSLLSFG